GRAPPRGTTRLRQEGSSPPICPGGSFWLDPSRVGAAATPRPRDAGEVLARSVLFILSTLGSKSRALHLCAHAAEILVSSDEKRRAIVAPGAIRLGLASCQRAEILP